LIHFYKRGGHRAAMEEKRNTVTASFGMS